MKFWNQKIPNFIYLFYINWKLTLFFIAVMPFIAFLVSIVSTRFRLISKRIQSAMGDVTQVTQEVVSGYQEVRMFGGAETERAVGGYRRLSSGTPAVSVHGRKHRRATGKAVYRVRSEPDGTGDCGRIRLLFADPLCRRSAAGCQCARYLQAPDRKLPAPVGQLPLCRGTHPAG